MKPLTQERAPTNAKQARRQRIDAVLISSDDSFLIELGPLLGDAYRTHTVDSPLALGSQLQKSGWLAIVDVAAVPDPRVTVARMAHRYPQAPIIVVAPRAPDWSAMVARGTIVAALAREEMTGAALNEALAAATARLSREGAEASADALRASARASARRAAGKRLGRLLPWAAALIGLLVAISWWHLHSSAKHPSAIAASNHSTATPSHAAHARSDAQPADAGSPASAPSRSQTILELLSAARVEFHDQRLLFPRADVEPRGDSALELYAQVLSQDPGNAEALDGIARLWAIVKTRIQSDEASGKVEDAARLIGLFRAAGMSEDLLRPVTASITASRPKWLLAHAQQSIAAGDLATAAQTIDQLAAAGADRDTLAALQRTLEAARLEQQLTALSGQVQAAIGAGTLLAPESDNALTHLSAMRALSRTHPLTLAAQRELRSALLAHAQQATRAHQFDLAKGYIAGAADLGGASELTEAKRQLQDEIDRAAESAAAASTAMALQAAAAAAADKAAATPAQPAAPDFIAAVPIRPLDVTYPQNADGIEGRVVVEFMLNSNGAASGVTVVEAKPKGLFERAAIDAVRRGRFDTRRLTADQPQRARISLHFKPD